MSVELVDLSLLRPHEETYNWRVEEMFTKIQSNGFFHKPLLVDSVTKTILDGHHRYEASLRLGLNRVPAILIDYENDHRIEVGAWPPAPLNSVTKELVIETSMQNRLMKPKSSKHTTKFEIPRLRIPLTEL